MRKKNKTVQSSTTPGHKMQLRSWLVELVMLRASGGRLPPYFWKEQKWKWRYTNEIKAVSKFIKTYGELAVLNAVLNNRELSTFSSYGDIEFLLQKEDELVKKQLTPKDYTEVKPLAPLSDEDYREPVSFVKKKSLFDRLRELENEICDE